MSASSRPSSQVVISLVPPNLSPHVKRDHISEGCSWSHHLPTSPVDLPNTPKSSGHESTSNLRRMLEEYWSASREVTDEGISRHFTVRTSAGFSYQNHQTGSNWKIAILEYSEYGFNKIILPFGNRYCFCLAFGFDVRDGTNKFANMAWTVPSHHYNQTTS